MVLGPSHDWEKKKPVSSYDTPFMSDGTEGGGCSGGEEEMAERGSSSRKRGRGVKWRQVFHDKPYNPPPPLYSSSPTDWSIESTAHQPKNRHLSVNSLFSFTFFVCL